MKPGPLAVQATPLTTRPLLLSQGWNIFNAKIAMAVQSIIFIFKVKVGLSVIKLEPDPKAIKFILNLAVVCLLKMPCYNE